MPGPVGVLQHCCCCCSGLPSHGAVRSHNSSGTAGGSHTSRFSSITPHGRCRLGKGSLHSQPKLGSWRPAASRDPDRVSTLSADEASLADSSSTQTYETAQKAPTRVLQDTSPALQARESSLATSSTTSSSSQVVSSIPSSSQPGSSQQHDQHSRSFGVTAQQLRQLVQAGVDDSQADSATSLVASLTQQLLQKQQQRKHHKHGHRATAGTAADSSGSTSSMALSDTSSLPHVSNGCSANNGTAGGTAAAAASSSSGTGLSQLPRALASALGSSLSKGLPGTAGDAAARVAAFGSNSLAAAATSSFLQLLLEAASDSTLLLLMAAGGVSLGLAASTGKEAVDYIDGAAILASVAICVTVTAVTNYQKEAKFRQLNSLKENIPVRVMRGGEEQTLSCFDLLVGDVLLVEAGDILPADGLLFAGGQLKVDESHLTGESDDVVKEPPSAASAAAAAAGSGGRNGSSEGVGGQLSSCLCMSGSKVLEGFGRMLVLAVGPNSQQGMIQAMVMNGTSQQQPGTTTSSSSSGGGSSMLREATPLMSRLEDVAGSIGGVGLAAAAAVLAVNSGLYTAELLGAGLSPWTSTSLEEYLSFFITSMTLLVVAVPEGLPLAVTLALAFSVQRMLSDNNLVRNLSSCETMAAATAICSDKTGTLTENNMAVVKLLVGGATFNVRPSARQAAAAAAATAGSSGSSPSRQGSPFGLLSGSSTASVSSKRSTRSPTLRSTSSIAATTGTESETDDEGGAATVAVSPVPSATASSNGSSSGSSSIGSSPSSAAASTSLDAASWSGQGGAARRRQEQQQQVAGFRPDVLTMVSLSLDGETLDAVGSSRTAAHQQQQQGPVQDLEVEYCPPDAVSAGGSSGSNSDSELLTATSSYLGSSPAGVAAEGATRGSPRLSSTLKQLLADSISLNSTASIRLVEADGSSSTPDSSSSSEQQLVGQEPLVCATNGGSRQLDRSGNRTECALLEFGGRLEGRLLPGCGSAEQQRRVLQVFPFSSTRKRMSSLVASGPALTTPGTGGSGQPARLYVKGAAELLLDSCRLQVGLDGALEPLPPGRVQALKACCGRGGLRVLALAYKDMLLQPAQDSSNNAAAAAAAGGSSAAGPQQQQQQQQQGTGGPEWQLLDGDDDQKDLVLIGLLALEDPVRVEVPGAIRDCQRAGIAVRMITGDNAATGAAIATSCGILPPQLAQQVEEARTQMAAAAAAANSSSNHSQQQQQIAQLRQAVASLVAERKATAGSSSSNSSSESGSSSSSSSWLDGVLHGLGGTISGKADPDAGAALMSSVVPDPRLAVIEGPVFRALVLRPDGSTDLDAFAALWPHMRVMARCTPADKFTLVQAVKALRARGELMETIAVTGDGTNDAPALNAADVGFAMAAGTSIAKDASDILLLDNNFRSIVSAVKWGRNVYSSVTKFLQFQLTANVVALVTAAGGALALRSSPLSAVQMLWVNLIMDSLASLALATEAPSDGMLDEPPRVRDGPIITPTVAKSIVGQAGLQLAVMAALLGPLGDTLTHHTAAAAQAAAGAGAAVTDAAVAAAAAVAVAAGADGGAPDRIEQYTLVFNSFVLMQLFNQLNSRKIHDEPNVLEGLSQQKLFLIILGLELGLQVAIVEAGGRAFSTVPLSSSQWAVCVGFGGLTLLFRQVLRLIPTEPPPPSGGSSSNSSSGSGGRQQWQQGAAVAMSAVRAVAAAPVQGVKGVMAGVAAAVGRQLAGRHKASAPATKQQQALQQPSRR